VISMDSCKHGKIYEAFGDLVAGGGEVDIEDVKYVVKDMEEATKGIEVMLREEGFAARKIMYALEGIERFEKRILSTDCLRICEYVREEFREVCESMMSMIKEDEQRHADLVVRARELLKGSTG